jgi:hypothetical protein
METIRIRGGEICVPPHPGGIFTHTKVIQEVKRETKAQKVSMVSKEVWDFLRKRYKVEKIALTREI